MRRMHQTITILSAILLLIFFKNYINSTNKLINFIKYSCKTLLATFLWYILYKLLDSIILPKQWILSHSNRRIVDDQKNSKNRAHVFRPASIAENVIRCLMGMVGGGSTTNHYTKNLLLEISNTKKFNWLLNSLQSLYDIHASECHDYPIQ